MLQSNKIDMEIMSEQGKIESVWESFISNIDKSDIVVKCIGDKIIPNLTLTNPDYPNIINKLHNISTAMESSNPLYPFLRGLDNSLTEYIIDDKKTTNNKINTSGKMLESSYQGEMGIIYTLLENGLLDSNEVQSLLDNQSLELSATANRIISMCGRGEPPSTDTRSSGVLKASPLTLEDFGTDASRILECVEHFITEDVDLFPNSPPEVCNMLFPREDFDSQVLYSQDNYISNLANYDIISATTKYIEDSFNVDKETSTYILTTLISQLKDFINKFDKKVCLILYMATLMVLKENFKESEGLDNISLNYSIKKELANAFSMYEKEDFTNKPNMIRIPQELRRFANISDCIDCEDDVDSTSNLDTAFNDILSSIDEIDEIMKYYGLDQEDIPCNEQSSIESVTENSLRVECGDSKTLEQTESYMSIVNDTAEKVHNDLNHSLLEGNFNTAANQIAIGVALLEQLHDNQLLGSEQVGTLRRDIMTYQDLVSEQSHDGISSNLTSARSYIMSVLEK